MLFVVVVSSEFSNLLSQSLPPRLQNCDQKLLCKVYRRYKLNYWKLCTALTIGRIYYCVCLCLWIWAFVLKSKVSERTKYLKDRNTKMNLFNKIKWENRILSSSVFLLCIGFCDKLMQLVCNNCFWGLGKLVENNLLIISTIFKRFLCLNKLL